MRGPVYTVSAGVMLVAVGAAGSAPSVQTARIVFASDRGPAVSGEIYAVDGSGRRRNLSRDSRVDASPVPSPDGTRVAWACERTGDAYDPFGICVAGTDGSGARLVAARASYPTWSPDGSRLAYSAYAAGGGIFVDTLDGAPPRLVAAGGRPSWSPRGPQIAYSGTSGARVVDVETGADRAIAPDVPLAYSTALRWSPDGTRVAFAGGPELARGSVYVARADGSGVARVSQPPLPCDRDGDPAWAPDGTRLVFSRELWRLNGRECNPDRRQLLIVGADGSGLEVLTTPPSSVYHTPPAWSPRADEIAFVRSLGDAASGFSERRIYVVRVRELTTRVVPMGPRERVTGDPAWSADGGTLFYSSLLDNDFDLFSMRADGADVRRITDTAVDESRPVPSPDGRAIVFSRGMVVGGKPSGELFLVGPDGRHERRLTHNDAGESWPTWSPDAKRLVYLRSTRDGRGRIYAVDVATGREEPLAGAGGARLGEPALSPDGRLLAGTVFADAEPRIAVLDLSRRRLRAIGPSCTSAPSWSPDGRRLTGIVGFCSAARGCPAAIVVMGRDGGGYRAVSRATDCHAHPRWSPDGRELVWSSGGLRVLDLAAQRLREPARGPGYVAYLDPAWLPVP